MGLDMYLSARRYIGAWTHGKQEERDIYGAVLAAVDKKEWKCERSPHLYVEISVACWRKANQIHKWFVANVQDGVDECRDFDVERTQLTELRDLCQEVLEHSRLVPGKVNNGMTFEGGKVTTIVEEGRIIQDASVAAEKLPTQDGFFFGSTDYDEYYWNDLRDTVAQIDAILAEFGDEWRFVYRASW